MEDAKVGIMTKGAKGRATAGPRAALIPAAASSFLAEGEIISIEPKEDP